MTTLQKFIDYLTEELIDFEQKVRLKDRTWIHRGGIAGIWIQPSLIAEFEKVVSWCQINKVRFDVIGNTSNCYFINDYNPDVIISTLKITHRELKGDLLSCGCGHNMMKLSRFCIENGIPGFEGFVGLPGTVGGAAINNAGCYGSLMSDLVDSVVVIRGGENIVLSTNELNYRNRNSVLKINNTENVLLTVRFRIKDKQDSELLEQRAKEFRIHRLKFQESKFPNLGSVFSNLELNNPLLIRVLESFLYRVAGLIIRNPVRKQKFRIRLFFFLRGAGEFRRYVSDYTKSCFLWKDAGADKAFLEYLDFFHRNTTKAELEISIKSNNRTYKKAKS